MGRRVPRGSERDERHGSTSMAALPPRNQLAWKTATSAARGADPTLAATPQRAKLPRLGRPIVNPQAAPARVGGSGRRRTF